MVTFKYLFLRFILHPLYEIKIVTQFSFKLIFDSSIGDRCAMLFCRRAAVRFTQQIKSVVSLGGRYYVTAIVCPIIFVPT